MTRRPGLEPNLGQPCWLARICAISLAGRRPGFFAREARAHLWEGCICKIEGHVTSQVIGIKVALPKNSA